MNLVHRTRINGAIVFLLFIINEIVWYLCFTAVLGNFDGFVEDLVELFLGRPLGESYILVAAAPRE